MSRAALFVSSDDASNVSQDPHLTAQTKDEERPQDDPLTFETGNLQEDEEEREGQWPHRVVHALLQLDSSAVEAPIEDDEARKRENSEAKALKEFTDGVSVPRENAFLFYLASKLKVKTYLEVLCDD